MNIKEEKRKLIESYILETTNVKKTLGQPECSAHLKQAVRIDNKFKQMFGQDIGRFYTLILRLQDKSHIYQ